MDLMWYDAYKVRHDLGGARRRVREQSTCVLHSVFESTNVQCSLDAVAT